MSVWILGAPDPEMAAIEAVLRAHGQRVEYATLGGRRVSPAEAYRADGPRVEEAGTTMMVECEVPTAGGVYRCDHHRPGDPGFGRPPSDYWEASSLGQVMAILGQEPTPLDRMVAAADHCLAAAYRGECPGVGPDALMEWRVRSRAAFQQRDPEALLADVRATQAALTTAPRIVLRVPIEGPRYGVCDGYCPDTPHVHYVNAVVADMRREPPWPELPEAATRLGLPYISGPLVDRDGRRKITVSGGAAVVQAFLDGAGPGGDLLDRYGDPARGFAGGYLPD